MKKILFSLSFCFCCLLNIAQAQNTPQSDNYQFFVDLTKVKDDKLQVDLIVPKVGRNESIYYIPKIVPGTYSIYDFGRFITDFKATDAKGNELTTIRLDDNRWQIKPAEKLYKITYWVEDTYDTDKGNFIFEPCGTNIEENKNYVLNTHGFFGYLEGMKANDYELNITKPENFFGSSALKTINKDAKIDKYIVDDYMQLADAPMMYNLPDTVVMNVGGAEILISVYSPQKNVTAKYVAENIGQILNAQRDYLGGQLPIKRYAFIIYLFQDSKSNLMGALEHSYSSMYFLPDQNPESIAQTIRDVAAHEFFHIITPLNIHSEEIGDFDYINPKMSKHLWMYEGVTEYFAGHVQAKYGLMSEEKYMDVVRGKIIGASEYNEKISFTDMSKKCLDEHKEQYGNVYEKGALIGLCLDIKLKQLSGGKYSVQMLMADLSKTYGKDKSFKDDELFDKITALTFPEIRQFFANHVENPTPLPLKEVFNAVGYLYDDKVTTKMVTLGNISLGVNEKNIVVEDISGMNTVGEKMGYHNDDIILEINGEKITPENAQGIIKKIQTDGKVGDPLLVVVQRTDKGKVKIKKLKGKMETITNTEYFRLAPNPKATPEQLAVRKAWLGK